MTSDLRMLQLPRPQHPSPCKITGKGALAPLSQHCKPESNATVGIFGIHFYTLHSLVSFSSSPLPSSSQIVAKLFVIFVLGTRNQESHKWGYHGYL